MSEYGVIILGGTGQVGSAVVKTFVNSPRCREVVLLSRRPIANSWGERVRVVTVDPEKANFVQEVAALVQACAPRVMFAVSCVGVGSGSLKWSDEELIKLEVGIVGAFARGCKAGGVTNFGLLTAAGTSSDSLLRKVVWQKYRRKFLGWLGLGTFFPQFPERFSAKTEKMRFWAEFSGFGEKIKTFAAKFPEAGNSDCRNGADMRQYTHISGSQLHR